MTRLTMSIAQRVGRRGTALLFFALLDVVYAISLANPVEEVRRSKTLVFVQQIMPLYAWSMLWLVVGIVCAIGAFMQKDRWAFTAAMFLKVLWGTVFLLGWALYGLERGYVSAVIWLVFAGWIYVISTWPEPSVPARKPGHDRGDR